jgi:hypothetical protein
MAQSQYPGGDDELLPVVVRFQVGELPDGNITIRLLYATSLEKLDNDQLETALFAMTRKGASEFAKRLRGISRPAAPDRRKPH